MKLPYLYISKANQYFIMYVVSAIATAILSMVLTEYNLTPLPELSFMVGGMLMGWFMHAFLYE